MTTPASFLREATKAVPAVKYALGVGGIIAVIAIVFSFRIDPRVAFVGAIVMLALMGILVVFARMTALASRKLSLPAVVFTWFILTLFMAVSISLFTSVFFKMPLDLQYWLTGDRYGPTNGKPQKEVEVAAAEDEEPAAVQYEKLKVNTNDDASTAHQDAAGESRSPGSANTKPRLGTCLSGLTIALASVAKTHQEEARQWATQLCRCSVEVRVSSSGGAVASNAVVYASHSRISECGDASGTKAAVEAAFAGMNVGVDRTRSSTAPVVIFFE